MASMATFSRIKAPIACAIILAFFVAGAVMDFPDYGKAIYKSAEAVDYDEYKDQTGFPAGEGYEELTSVEEINSAEKNYILKVDAKELEPLKLYREISEKKYYTRKFAKYIGTDGGVGTFYVAKLKSGEKIIVFIDDRSFDIPKSGTVELPVASTKKMTNTEVVDFLQDATGLSEENLQYYVDTAGEWRESEDGQKIQDKAVIRGMLAFLIVVIPCGFLFSYTEKREEKKNR